MGDSEKIFTDQDALDLWNQHGDERSAELTMGIDYVGNLYYYKGELLHKMSIPPNSCRVLCYWTHGRVSNMVYYIIPEVYVVINEHRIVVNKRERTITIHHISRIRNKDGGANIMFTDMFLAGLLPVPATITQILKSDPK